jgi:hypothetical protein
MKQLFFFSFACLLAAQLTAQQDTTYYSISTEEGTLTAQTLETERDRLFGYTTPSRWMLNIHRNVQNYNNNSTNSWNQGTLIGLEYKLTPGLSMGVNYSAGFQSDFGDTKGGTIQTLELEQRYYFDMAKRIKKRQHANNFSGQYFSLSERFTRTSQPASANTNVASLQLRYGVQRRFMKHGFFDISAGLGLGFLPNGNSSNTWLNFDQRVKIGLAIFQRSKQAPTSDGAGFCEVLRCFEEEKQMWKINLINSLQAGVFNYGTSLNQGRNSFASIIPNLAYERKIGRSPFSVELSGDLGLSTVRLKSSTTTDQFNYLDGKAQGELRWYHSQKKQILTGKSGNNLSGPFAAVNTGFRYQYSYVNDGSNDYTNKYVDAHLVWGYQQRLFKRGYALAKFGLGASNDLTNNIVETSILAEFKAGFAF